MDTNSEITNRLLMIDKNKWSRWPYSEILARLEVVQNARSKESLILRIQETLLADEFHARETLEAVQWIRENAGLPEPISELPPIDQPSLELSRDF